jgi:hypothetical protein
MRALRFVALGLSLAYALPVACGSNGLVGGKCKKGTGACSDAADGGRNQTTNAMGGALNNGGASNTEAGNGAATQGGDGQLPDGGFVDSPVDGETDAEVPLECLPPHDAPSHCGDCDTTCSAPKPFCAPDGDGSFLCVPLCEPPLVECQGQCVDPESYNSDPDNCGECGNACPSDICQDGLCRGARYGNVALVCSDLNSATSDSGMTALLGNAVFMPLTNPVKVLAYTRGASAAAVNKVNLMIAAAGSPRSRTAEITEATTVQAVTADLNIDDYQVLLIHDLDQAESGDPAAAATTWESSSVLTSFAKAGGVIVVLDGGDGTGEMHELINAGNLLDPTQKTKIAGQLPLFTSGESPMAGEVWNNAPFDVIGFNVLSQFRATSHTCTFVTDALESSELIFVLTDAPEIGEGAPVAIHRVIAP